VTQHQHRQLGVFLLLVAFGVLGRWLQPEWNVTPLVGVAAFAGYYFGFGALALATPLAVLAVSNLLLPAYDNWPVMAVVYGMLLLPVLLGYHLRGREKVWRLCLCGFVPATLFFLVTNFAVWLFKSSYAPTLAGLLECYAYGLPFYRAMLLGDLFYLTAVFGAYALAMQAGYGEPAWAEAPLAKRKD